MEEYESIKEKLKKLLVLSQRGEGGEAENAKELLDQLCEKYSISLDELLDSKRSCYSFKLGDRKVYEDLFFHCFFKIITDDDEVKSQTYSRKGRRIFVNLTALQYAEISSLFEWHKRSLKAELKKAEKSLLLAYIIKHNLNLRKSLVDKKDNSPLTDEEIESVRMALGIMGSLSDRTYQKSLTNK